MASVNSATQYLHRLEDHTSAVKALAWCPFQANLLAFGRGGVHSRLICLFMAQSPDGCTVATTTSYETLRLWNVFGTPLNLHKRQQHLSLSLTLFVSVKTPNKKNLTSNSTSPRHAVKYIC
ncbi:hypothetical protein ACFE04_005097 [Oxalis oulophora]